MRHADNVRNSGNLPGLSSRPERVADDRVGNPALASRPSARECVERIVSAPWFKEASAEWAARGMRALGYPVTSDASRALAATDLNLKKAGIK